MKKIFYVCQQKIKAHFKYLILQLLLILFFIFLCYVFSLPPAPPPPPAPTSPRPSVEVDSSLLEKEKADSVFNQFRACSDQAFADTESDEGFISRYRQCIDSKIPSFQFDRFAMGRMDEYKVFLPMKESFDPKSCRWMTIGVGGTDNAEKEFKAKYSQCKVFGVEPSPSQYANFEDYGTIIPYGVGKTRIIFAESYLFHIIFQEQPMGPRNCMSETQRGITKSKFTFSQCPRFWTNLLDLDSSITSLLISKDLSMEF